MAWPWHALALALPQSSYSEKVRLLEAWHGVALALPQSSYFEKVRLLEAWHGLALALALPHSSHFEKVRLLEAWHGVASPCFGIGMPWPCIGMPCLALCHGPPIQSPTRWKNMQAQPIGRWDGRQVRREVRQVRREVRHDRILATHLFSKIVS